MIDYRVLLKKYMAHVLANEGVVFVERGMRKADGPNRQTSLTTNGGRCNMSHRKQGWT